MHNTWLYILIMAGVSFLIRVLPMTLLRKPIKSRFLRSFLFYVPYITLSVMTFPAIMQTGDSVIPGLIALVLGIGMAWAGCGLFPVAIGCCAVVLVAQLIL